MGRAGSETREYENLLESAVRPTHHTVNAIKLKVQQKDESDWFGQIWNDRGVVYDNKLRTYRRFKKDRKPEHYAKQYMPRPYRSVLTKLRCGGALLGSRLVVSVYPQLL